MKKKAMRAGPWLVVLLGWTAAEAQDPPKSPSRLDPSRFQKEIGKEKHAEGKPPADALNVRFDFSGKRAYAFDQAQQAEITVVSGSQDPRPTKQKVDMTGHLILKSKGDRTGTLTLRDLKASMTMEMHPGEPPKTMELQPPATSVPNVKEDGTMEGGAANVQPLLKLLFPMPPRPLKPGESVDVPMSMPFNAMGSALTVKGTSKVTHGGYFLVGGKNCARLDVAIDISQLDVPKEIPGKYASICKGKSVYYYDVESDEFASGETAIFMRMAAEGSMPGSKTGDPDKPEERPKTVQMTMESDNLIRLVRNSELAKKEAGEK